MAELKKRGLIMHCWKVHKGRMIRLGLPYVSYSSFRHRVLTHNWSYYRAIHTPATVKFRQQERIKDMRYYSLYCKIKHFFKRLFN